MLRFSREIRTSTAFAASSTLEPAPGSGPLIRYWKLQRAPHPSPSVHGTPGSTFSHGGEKGGCPLLASVSVSKAGASRSAHRSLGVARSLIRHWKWQGPLIRLRAFTERPDPPSPTAGRRMGDTRRPPRMPPFSPAWEKVSAQLTDEGGLACG